MESKGITDTSGDSIPFRTPIRHQAPKTNLAEEISDDDDEGGKVAEVSNPSASSSHRVRLVLEPLSDEDERSSGHRAASVVHSTSSASELNSAVETAVENVSKARKKTVARGPLFYSAFCFFLLSLFVVPLVVCL